MKLYDLGELDWKRSQLVYHALAYENIESVVVHSTRQKYICLGLPQHPEEELDLEYCRENDIGVFRREIGGGVVLLDRDQVFYHVILNRSDPEVPRIPLAFFKKYLRPVINAYKDLGIDAEYRPLCDLVASGKKISGNGGGEVAESMVLAGGMLLDFDHETMARAIRASDHMRARYLEQMLSGVTTVKQETGELPDKDSVRSALMNRFEEFFGPMERQSLPENVIERERELEATFFSDEWFLQRGTNKDGRELKVREGTFIFEYIHKTEGADVAVTVETEENKVACVKFSDDHPLDGAVVEKINTALTGIEYDCRNVANVIRANLEATSVQEGRSQ